MLIKAALNGSRGRHEHEALPLSPASLASDAVKVRAAGAGAVHVHARDRFGRETLDAEHCADTIDAIRAACPGLPIGLTTGLWIVKSADQRLALIDKWTRIPDFCSVNFSEDGTDELCDLLIRKGVGIEAGLASVADARVFAGSAYVDRLLRVLIEVDDPGVDDPVAAAEAIARVLEGSGIHRPIVQHGSGSATWPVLRAAVARGYDVRIGLEDTLLMPDGSPAANNAALVAAAAALVNAHA
ncbi:MAG: 3-keto-5-aminohexanoate cleavage protein [Candidatus Dormibacteraeota bacterium]|nr:3-keto-5-aminohexanoate cleavage protein [Candidatus Dormibacteraeota bacterium]